MRLRNKAQHRLNCIVDGRDTYRIEWFRLLHLVFCKIRLISNDTQSLDMLPLQFHVSFLPCDHTT